MFSLKKTLLLSAVCAFCSFALWHIVISPRYHSRHALDAFISGDIEHALPEIMSIHHTLPEAKYHLYLSYLYRSLGDKEEAFHRLSLADDHAHRSSQGKSTLLEIALYRAFSAYNDNNIPLLETSVHDAEQLAPHNGYTHLFSGLVHFIHGDYEKALSSWSDKNDLRPLSRWMSKGFGTVLMPSWKLYHIARCHIEIGNYAAAHDLIDSCTAIPQNDLLFLKALCSVAEAGEQPLSLSPSLYAHARSYYHKMIFDPHAHEILAHRLSDAAQTFFSSNMFPAMGLLINDLEKWHARNSLSQLAAAMSRSLFDITASQSDDELHASSIAIAHHVDNGVLRKNLAESAAAAAFEKLSTGATDSAISLWNAATQLATDLTALKDGILTKTLSDIDKALLKDEIDTVKQIATFWNSIPDAATERSIVAKKLFDLSNTAWNRTANHTLSTLFLKIAATLPPDEDKSQFLEAIDNELVLRFLDASHNNDIKKMTISYDAMTAFGYNLGSHIIIPEIANQIGDAWYLFSENRYDEAFDRAEWVLRAAPENQKALHIAGSIAFHRGNYPYALKTLAKLTNPAPKTEESLGICHLYTGSSKKGEEILTALSHRRALNDATYILLAYCAQEQEEYDRSIAWLLNIKSPSGDALATLCHAFYKIERWDEAIQCYKATPPPYNNLPSLRAIAGTAFAHLGDDIHAEELFTGEPIYDVSTTLPSSFRIFYNNIIASEDPSYLAALFFHENLHDDERAMACIDKVSSMTSEMLLKKGELLFALARDTEASKIFEHVARNGTPDNVAQAQLMLGKILLKKQRHSEALDHLKLAMKLSPDNHEMLRALFECLQYKIIADSDEKKQDTIFHHS